MGLENSDGSVKVFVLGHFGAHNTGDDAMLLSILRELHAGSPKLEFEIGTKHGYLPPGVEALGGTSLPLRMGPVLRAIWRSKYILHAGGTHIHDSMGGQHYKRMLLAFTRIVGILALGRLFGKRVVSCSIGIGPCRYRLTKLFAWWYCVLPHYLSLRDEESLQAARACGVKGLIPVGADAASLLECSPGIVRNAKYLGVNLITPAEQSPLVQDQLQTIYDTLAIGICGAMDADPELRVRAFVFRGGSKYPDLPVTRSILEPLLLRWPSRIEIDEYNSDPQTVVDRMAECKVMICSRYHALMLGANAGCRLMCVAYQPKVEALARQIGLPEERVICPAEPQACVRAKAALSVLLDEIYTAEHKLTLESLRISAAVHCKGFTAVPQPRSATQKSYKT